MYIDYRRQNSVIERPIFPIPDAGELFDTLGDAHYFSTIDLSQGYYQVKMEESDIEKTALTEPFLLLIDTSTHSVFGICIQTSVHKD